MTVVLRCSETNCVQVALGRDADGDGDLSPEETGALFGWRAGRSFVEDAATGERFLGAERLADDERALSVAVEADDDSWLSRTVSISEDGEPAFADAAGAARAFAGGWDTVKATRRGALPQGESISIDQRFAPGLVITVR